MTLSPDDRPPQDAVTPAHLSAYDEAAPWVGLLFAMILIAGSFVAGDPTLIMLTVMAVAFTGGEWR